MREPASRIAPVRVRTGGTRARRCLAPASSGGLAAVAAGRGKLSALGLARLTRIRLAATGLVAGRRGRATACRRAVTAETGDLPAPGRSRRVRGPGLGWSTARARPAVGERVRVGPGPGAGGSQAREPRSSLASTALAFSTLLPAR